MSYMNTAESIHGTQELTLAELDYVVGGCCCNGCSCGSGDSGSSDTGSSGGTKSTNKIKVEGHADQDGGGVSVSWEHDY